MPRDARGGTDVAASALFAQPILVWLLERVHVAAATADEAIK